MKKSFFAAALLALCLSISGQADPPIKPDSVSGIWYVEGTDSRGKDYAGTATFTPTGDDVWQIDSVVLGNHSAGVAIRKGRALAISWRELEGKAFGVTLLEIGAGEKVMSGLWSMPGGKVACVEKYSFVRKVGE